MENPFTHNRATNLIGQVLDQEALDAKHEETCDHKGTDCCMRFGSLEYVIMMMLFNNGCLTEHALETVGLEGRGDPKPRKLFTPEQAAKITTVLKKATETVSCAACQKSERREWTEPEEHTCSKFTDTQAEVFRNDRLYE